MLEANDAQKEILMNFPSSFDLLSVLIYVNWQDVNREKHLLELFTPLLLSLHKLLFIMYPRAVYHSVVDQQKQERPKNWCCLCCCLW